MKRAYSAIKEIIRTRPKVLILIIVLVCADAGLFLYSSLYQTPQLTELQNQWFSRRRNVGSSPADKVTIYQQGKADLEVWRSRIADKKDLARIVGQLYELAATNSVTIAGITYKPEIVKDENLIAYGTGFNVTGKYAAVKSFIADLGHLREMVIVDAIALNNPKMTEERVDLRVGLTIYLRQGGQ